MSTEDQPLGTRLRDVLPPWTHWTNPFGIAMTATWTTPAGTWSVSQTILQGQPTVTGPKVALTVPAEQVVPVLTALGALDFEPTGGTA